MNRSSFFFPRLALLLIAAVASPLTVTAATLDFQVLLDVDNNVSTGCSVAGMTGVDQVVVSTVTTTETTGTVTSMGRRVCTAGVLGSLLDVTTTGYDAGYNPNSGQMVVESRIAYSALGSGPFTMRVGFAGQTGTSSNAVLTRNNGQPILFPEASHGRRRPATPGNLDERVLVLDGQPQDWGTIPPLASGSASGQQAFRLSQVYGYGDGQFFWFRIDANLSKNPPPTANDDAYSVRQGQALVVPAPGVLLNDTDPSGLPLTAQVVTNPTHGTLSFNSNGSFAYINDGAFVASDSFEYRASNGSADSNTAKVIITIIANGVPQALNNSYSVAHRGTLNVTPPGVLGNDSDPDGDPLTAIQLSSPTNGSLTFNGNGSFVYTHNGSNTLSDSFQYAASDTFSQSNPAQVNITVAADIPPTAVGDAYTVPEGGTINQTAPGLFTNDSDPDTPQSLWTAQVVTAPTNGTLTMGAGGAFTYVHNGGETTSDSFVYRVNDGIANSNNATVAITITPVNDAPVAVNDVYNTNEDTPLTITAPGLLTNDTDSEGTTLTATRVTNATNGNVTVNTNGSFTYTPNANFNGTDTFTYTASDGAATSNTATVTITVAAVNDAPSFTAGANVTVNEDSGAYNAAWATAISSGPADESAQTVLFNVSNDNNTLFSAQPVIAPNGTLTFTPAANANGSATITVSLSDTGSNAAPNVNTSATVNFTITVNAVNDAPSFTKGADQTVNEDAGAQTVNPWATAISAGPADEAGQTLTFNATNDNNALFTLGGQPAVSPAGVLTYTPAANANGSATVTVSLSDTGSGTAPNVNTSAAQQFTITISAVNDAPVNTVPGAQNINEDIPLVFSAGNGNAISVADVDAGTAPFRATVNVTNGTATAAAGSGATLTGNASATLVIDGTLTQVNAALNGMTFTPTANYSGAATIQLVSSDLGATGTGGTQTDTDSVTINITAVNDAPVFTSGGNVAVNEDSGAYSAGWATGISAGAPDEGGQTLTFNVSNDNNALFTGGGQPAVASNGTLTFTPAANASGSATVTITLSDNGVPPATSASVQFTITVNPVNDAPVVATSGGTTAFVEDAGAVAVDNALTISDIDSLTLTGATVMITNVQNAGDETLAAPTVVPGVTASYVAPTLTFSGSATLAEYQTMLRAVTYNNSNNSPNTTNRIIAFQVNDGGAVNNLSNVANKTVSLAATNDAPVVTTTGTTTSFTEDGGPVTVDGGLTVTDVDSTNLMSATVTITNLLDGAAEVLAANAGITGIVVVYNAGVLTLTHPTGAPVIAYQTVLRTVTYNNGSNNPNTTNRILAFVVNDGATNSAASNKTVSITAVNDAAVVTASGGATAFVEDAGAVAVDGAITVTDIDSTNLASATVTITNVLDAGVETLAAPTLLGAATASYAAPTLTISGAATVAEYQTMLRAVTYNNASNNPNTTNRVISFQVNDGAGVNNLSNVSNKTVSVAATNDAPVVTASGGTTAFTEDGGAVVVDGGVTTSDVDNTNLASATVTITNLLDAGVEVLAAPTLLGGVTANYVAPTLTLTGSASLADYQTMLRAVTYNNTSQNPTTTNRVLAFVVNDGTINSAASNKTVSVTAVNDAPVVTASGGTTAFVEDAGAVAVDGAITVTDIDSANLASATVTITNLLDAGVETLAAPTLLGAATASYVAPTLTISGAATVAEYQTMLRAVTYNNASNNPNTTNRVIRFQVNDGAGVNNLSNQSDKTLSVAATNDAPVVTASGGTTAFTEDGGAVVVDGGVTTSDVDNTNLASATVTITNVLDLSGSAPSASTWGGRGGIATTLVVVVGAETLAAPTLLGGVTANYVAPTLTLTGSASLADYQTMLRAVTYNNTSQNPTTTNRILAFQVNDGATNSAVSNKTVSVAAVNDAPVVTASGGTTAFVEDGPAIAVDSAITVTDIDSANQASATVTITNLLDAGLETLAAPTLLGAATASYVAPTLTISGAATVAQYQAMLRAVTYTNASNTPNTTDRIIRFQTNDGAGVNNLSNQSDKTLSVATTNDAPVVTTSGGTVTFTEAAGAIVIDNGMTVTDVDSANIASATVTITNLLDAGQETLAAPTLLGGATASYVAPTLTITGTTTLANYELMLRAVTYNNASTAPNTTQRSIGFQVNDGAGVNNLSNTATRGVVVVSVNSQPVVTTSGGTTAFVEDGPAVAIDGALTVTDPDTTTLASATVTISNLLDTGLETLNAPTLLGGATANYVAPTLTITGTTTLANYQTMLRAVTYSNASNTPNTTNRTINFQGNDGQGANNLSSVAAKTVSVTPTNDAPVVTTSGGTTAFTEGGGAVVVDSGVTVSDVDSALIAVATVTISNLLNAGLETLAAPTLLGAASASYVAPTLTISGAATVAQYQTMLAAVTYNNSSNNPNTTARTINFQVTDGEGLNSTVAGKSVSVTGVNSAPVVTTSGGTTAFVEDAAAVAIDGALTVTDADSANLTQATITISNLLDAGMETLSAPTLLGGATANYVAPTLTISGSTTVANYQTMLRAVRYNNASNTPNTTNRTVNFQVTDGTDVSNTAGKTVSVAATNDAPVVVTTGGNTAFTEDGGAVTIDSGVTVTDADSANLASATVTITNLLDAGVETLAAPTLLGAASASYVAPTLTITGAATVAQYQTMLAAVTYNNTSQNPSTTSRVIAFVANDGTSSSTAANKTVTVAGVNDAPVVTTTGTTTAFTEDGGAVAVDTGITVSDIDSTNLASATVTITNLLNAGVELLAAPTLLGAATASYVAPTLTISGAATVAQYQTMLAAVTYNNTSQDPNSTTRVINFQVNDGGGVNNLSNTASKNVSVAATNDPPTPNAAGPFNAQAGMKVTFPAATLGGTDVEPGTTVTVSTTPGTVTNGAVVLNANGSFEFTPTPASAGSTATFQYNVCDNGNPGPGVCSTTPVTVTLNVAGPVIHFVTAAGAGTACTVPAPCTLATAVAQIGATTNRKIFIMDNGSHNAAVPLNSQGWLIGQGVTGADFDTVFTINPAAVAPGTLDARPAINAAAPTVQQTVSLNSSTVVRGLAITTTTAVAMNDVQGVTFASPTVNETSLSATGFAALNLSDITAAALTFTSVNGNGGANAILINSVAGSLTVNGGTLQNTTAAAVSLTATPSLTTSLTNVTFNNTVVVGITGATFGTLSVSGVTLNSANQALNLTTGAVNGTFTSVSSGGAGNVTPVFLSGVTGNFTVSGGTVTDAGAANPVMNIVGGTATIVWSGGLTATNSAALVDISGTNTGNITFNTGTLSAPLGTGLVFAAANGTYAFNGPTTLNGLTNGITIGTSTGSFTFGSGVAITNTTGTAVSINGTQPVVLFSGTINQTTAQKAVVITGVTGGSTAGVATPNSIRFSGTISKTTGANNAVDINGNTGGNFGFLGTLTFDTSTANAINHSGNSGTTTSFATPAITTTTGHGLNFVNAGTVSIGGTIGTGAGNGVNGTTFTGTLSLSGAAITTGGGTGITLAGGAGTLQTTANSSINAAGPALVLNGTTLGTGTFSTLTSSAGANGISLTNVTGGTLTGSAGSLTGNSSHAFNVSGGTATVTYAGTITQHTAAQRAVNVTGITGGTLTFSGPVNSNSSGIILTTNTGGTINFTGQLTLNTGADPAFTATPGGTVSSSNTSSTITTTTGTAVNITTTIGAAGVTFASINSTAAGGNNTIILTNTGAGFFTCNGGTISNKTADAVKLTTTGGLVTLRNMTIQDITSGADGAAANDTHSNVDGIHGVNVNGGLTLDTVTIQRISDNGINGSVDAAPPTATVWNGLTLTNCNINNTNRFNVAGRADANFEGAVYIHGIKGTVSVTGTTFSNAGSGLFFATDTAGSLDMTVRSSNFTTLYKEIGTLSIGLYGISVVQHGSLSSLIRIGDTVSESNAALGNTFTNGGDRAAIRVIADTNATGTMKSSIARNTFTVTDHSSPGVAAGSTTYNFPQSGVLLRNLGTGLYESIFAANTFNECMHADGGLGNLTLSAEKGDSEFIVRNNTFNKPWDAPLEVRADGQATGQNSARVEFTGNSYIDGIVGDGTTDLGGQSPYDAFFVQVRNNGRMDFTMTNQATPLGLTDTSSGHGSVSFWAQTTTAGDVLNLFLANIQAPRGFRLASVSGTTFNLFRNGSGGGTPQLVLQDNNNRGGGGVDTTNPPTVSVTGTGTVTLSNAAPVLPSITPP